MTPFGWIKHRLTKTLLYFIRQIIIFHIPIQRAIKLLILGISTSMPIIGLGFLAQAMSFVLHTYIMNCKAVTSVIQQANTIITMKI